MKIHLLFGKENQIQIDKIISSISIESNLIFEGLYVPISIAKTDFAGVISLVTKKKIVDILGIVSIAIVVLSSISYIVMSFVITRKYPAEDYSELLTNYANFKMVYSSESIIFLVNSIFISFAIVMIFIIFYSKIEQSVKKWLILPTVTSIIGTLILISLIVVKLLLIATMAPDYVSAIEPMKSYILARFENVIEYLTIFQLIAFLLIYTIGTGVFGILSLKYKITKGSSAWLAIVTAILGLGEFGVFIPIGFGDVLILLRSIAFILYFIWLGSILIMIRQNMEKHKVKKVVSTTELLD
ncbi:MAG: hypothetical protein FK733_13685 [Asgard group archaeon]|nr:hypothetical protein [Asgard group archaeon]